MKIVRCAIYTRKSSDEGLEQDFNSLDAQREACAAYVLSQASEGWQLLPEHYDDGGISGGTLERPALKKMLADVAAGKIDIIVIYKIDRLTRSLLDFAKLVEQLEKADTSFVSVTQSFNTTTSMGRLTLNMLLSFAQFEREVTAERIRDKIAASKAKGMWMGGTPPLGYRPHGRSLKVVEAHAAMIRDIYARYQKLGNVRLVAEQMKGEGIMTPQRKSQNGQVFGGALFSRGQIYAILKNPIYAGNIAHRGTVFAGNHLPIIPQDEWDAVQVHLASSVKGARGSRGPNRSPLAGIIRDAAGQPMLASHTTRKGQRYRYYVSKSLHLAQADAESADMRIPAPEIEGAVAAELASLFDDPVDLAARTQMKIEPSDLMPLMARSQKIAKALRDDGLGDHAEVLSRVELHPTRIDIGLSPKRLAAALAVPLGALAPPEILVSRELRLTRTGRAIRLVQTNGAAISEAQTDEGLVNLIIRARGWWQLMRGGKIGPSELAKQEGVGPSYVSRVVRLAFLSPTVVEAVLDGKLKAGVGAGALLRHGAIAEDWVEQERQLIAA